MKMFATRSYMTIMLVIFVGGMTIMGTPHLINILENEDQTVLEFTAHEIEHWVLDDYALCMSMSLEEYVENKINSDRITQYNRGILDSRMSQCAINNETDDGWTNLKHHLPEYNECMDFYREKYIENKINSNWITDYNRGILDWQIEYCSKDPQISNHIQP